MANYARQFLLFLSRYQTLWSKLTPTREHYETLRAFKSGIESLPNMLPATQAGKPDELKGILIEDYQRTRDWADQYAREEKELCDLVTSMREMENKVVVEIVEHGRDPGPLVLFLNVFDPRLLNDAMAAVRIAAVLNEKPAQRNLDKRKKPKIKKSSTIAERMWTAVQNVPDRMAFSAGEWAQYLGCAKSSVANKKNGTWKKFQAARENRRFKLNRRKDKFVPFARPNEKEE
ncbi:MAG: hypothetical protein ACJ8FY_13720 [Gemmataceae bacterium]